MVEDLDTVWIEWLRSMSIEMQTSNIIQVGHRPDETEKVQNFDFYANNALYLFVWISTVFGSFNFLEN